MERRKSSRVAASSEVTCIMPSKTTRGTIRDISPKGCRVECEPGQILAGSTVSIDLLSGLNIEGKVKWVHGLTSGVEFDVSLNKIVIDYLVIRHDGACTRSTPLWAPVIDRFGRKLPALPPFKLPYDQ